MVATSQILSPVEHIVERNARIAIDQLGIILTNAGLNPDGTFTNINLSYSVNAKTANYPLLSTDSGKIFTNVGASGEVDFTLPTNSLGLAYTFVVGTAQTVKIIANTGSTISMGTFTSATSGNVTSNSTFSSITIASISSTNWVVVYSAGSWAVN